jgi:D-alanyl-D-alanine carboxypeptidase
MTPYLLPTPSALRPAGRLAPAKVPTRALTLAVTLATLLALTDARGAAAPLPDAEAMRRYAEQLLIDQGVTAQAPGVAVLVARGDELLVHTARGLASVELGVPLRPEQRFRLGSITKQFAAAWLLRLVDQGRVRLDDPLSRFLPQYPGATGITVAQLLNHTSGVRSYTAIPGYMHNPVRHDLDTAQMVAVFKDQPADFAPGTRWNYSNSGYVLVGAVIEAVTGQPWWQAASTLMAPVFYPAPGTLVPGHVSGYTRGPGGQVAPAGLVSMTQPHAAGALVADVQALWRWNQLLHEGGYLQPETYRRMTTPEGAATAAGYGYGISAGKVRGMPTLEHGGGIHGFRTLMQYLPGPRVTVALLSNTDAPGLNLDLMARQLAAQAAGQPYPPRRPAVPLDAATLRGYEGVYANDQASRTLRVVDGKLVSQRAGGASAVLVPQGADRFATDGGLAAWQFERGAVGRVNGLRYLPDGDGDGELSPRTGDAVVRADITLTPDQQQALVGEYVDGPRTMTVSVDAAGRLLVQLTGQPAIPVRAAGPRELYPTVVEATLHFLPAEGQARELVLEQGGRRLSFQRR